MCWERDGFEGLLKPYTGIPLQAQIGVRGDLPAHQNSSLRELALPVVREYSQFWDWQLSQLFIYLFWGRLLIGGSKLPSQAHHFV
jgi:hypothetical protein